MKASTKRKAGDCSNSNGSSNSSSSTNNSLVESSLSSTMIMNSTYAASSTRTTTTTAATTTGSCSSSSSNRSRRSNGDDDDDPCYLDCQSLQRTLKRVRLSSSPGELRLQLDLKQLVNEKNWIQNCDNDQWTKHYNQQHHRHQQQHEEDEKDEVIVSSSSSSLVLERCHADPLRLILKIAIQWSSLLSSSYTCNDSKSTENNNSDDMMIMTTLAPPPQNIDSSSSSTSTFHRPTTTTTIAATVWIQIPRHYPHRPPVIARISYDNNDDEDIPLLLFLRLSRAAAEPVTPEAEPSSSSSSVIKMDWILGMTISSLCDDNDEQRSAAAASW